MVLNCNPDIEITRHTLLIKIRLEHLENCYYFTIFGCLIQPKTLNETSSFSFSDIPLWMLFR
jgi:hypothetical protein